MARKRKDDEAAEWQPSLVVTGEGMDDAQIADLQAAWNTALETPRPPGMGLLVSIEVADRNARIAAALDESIRETWREYRIWQGRSLGRDARWSEASDQLVGKAKSAWYAQARAAKYEQILAVLFRIRRAGRRA